MKFTVERNYLFNALGTVNRAISPRSSMPILSNVLIETDDDRIKLTATDLDTAILREEPASIAEAGATAIPANLLADVVSKLPDAPVTIEENEGKVSVRCGKSNYNLLGQSAADYPPIPEIADGVEFHLEQRVLKDLLHHTTFAAATEETRSLLQGVLFDIRGGNLRAVATDTHRLAMKQVEGIEQDPVSIVIPAKPLAELGKFLSSPDELVSIKLAPSQAQFKTANTVLISRLLDGQFPAYEKVIPQNPERTFTANRAALLSAIQRVYIVAKGAAEKAIFTIEKDALTVTAESNEIGNAREEVAATLDGDGLTAAFNARYFIQVLSILSSENVKVELTGALNPVIVKPEGASDFLYVVMPMQV